MSAEIATGITDDPLDSSSLIDSARRDTCGAVASFIGVVRNHDGGRERGSDRVFVASVVVSDFA